MTEETFADWTADSSIFDIIYTKRTMGMHRHNPRSNKNTNVSLNHCWTIFLITTIIVSSGAALPLHSFSARSSKNPQRQDHHRRAMSASSTRNEEQDKDTTTAIQIAHIGNSIQYYNDCPRLLEHMLNERFVTVKQDSCLRGGASLASILEKGNGMSKKFSAPNAILPDGTFDIGSPTVQALLLASSWDFVVMNDHTQSPARTETKEKAILALKETYLPMILPTSTTVIFLQTAAYRRHVNGSEDLGTFDEFTEKLYQGYIEYVQLFPYDKAKLAPVGLAYQQIKKENPSLWERLYAIDDFHPSPHGTLLEASVLYCTIVGERPPVYNPVWWETARYMQPPETEVGLPLPTKEEAKYLQTVACQICQVTKSASSGDTDEQRSHL